LYCLGKESKIVGVVETLEKRIEEITKELEASLQSIEQLSASEARLKLDHEKLLTTKETLEKRVQEQDMAIKRHIDGNYMIFTNSTHDACR